MGIIQGFFTIFAVIKELIPIVKALFKWIRQNIEKGQQKQAARRIKEVVKATVDQRPFDGAFKRTDVLEATMKGTLDEIKRRYNNV